MAQQKTKGGQDYQAILQGLILEGLYALNEDKVIVRARKGDYGAVKKGIEGAVKEFKKTVGRDIKVEIDESEPLPDGSYVPIHCHKTRLSYKAKFTDVSIEPAVFLSSAVAARSTSTTPLKNACDYSKPMPSPPFEKRSSVRTRTGDFTIRVYYLRNLVSARYPPS